jgi:TRAP-type uncharacterized transport system fused permease subunit
MFTLTPDGLGILLRAPVTTVLVSSGTAAAGVAALAAGFGGWLRGPLGWPVRGVLAVAGGLLVYPAPWADLAGLALMAVVPILHYVLRSHPTAGTTRR